MRPGRATTDVINLLLDKGANIEAKEIDDPFIGDTALIRASYEGHAEMVRLLLEKGANIEATNKAGYTALIVAAENSKPEVVKVLLEKGANLAAKRARRPVRPHGIAISCNVQREWAVQHFGASRPTRIPYRKRRNSSSAATSYCSGSSHKPCRVSRRI